MAKRENIQKLYTPQFYPQTDDSRVSGREGVGSRSEGKLSESFFGCGSWSKRLSACGKKMRIIDPLTAYHSWPKNINPTRQTHSFGIGESIGWISRDIRTAG